jgi:AcrR family transcriptional regulator
MPRPRFYKLPLERRREIIEAAGKALGSSGYEGASLNRILEQAGLSKGAAYYYFDSKEDLVATVFLTLWERLLTSKPFDPKTLTAPDFWSSIAEFASEFFGSVKEEPWIAQAIKAMWGLPPQARASGPLAEAFETVTGWFAAILRRGRELGQVRCDLPEGLLLAIVMAMDEASDRWMFEHWDELEPQMLEQYAELTLDLFKRVLSPRGQSGDV